MRKPVFILRQSESTLSAIILPTLDRPATSDRSRLQAWSQWFIQPAVLIRVVLYATTLIYLRTALFDYVYDDSLLIIASVDGILETVSPIPYPFILGFHGSPA